MNVDVSVVIPARNRPKAIIDAITSVRNQTCLPREIIVVDDASTDETPTVVASLADGSVPVCLHRLSVNRGGGFARNVGIDAATGRLLAFLDSDDQWLPHRLEAQLSRIGSFGETDFLCFSNLRVDRADGSRPAPWNSMDYIPGGNVADYLLRANQAIQTSTFLMPKSTASRIRFDDRLRRHQDIDFVLRAAGAGVNFIYVPEVLVHYSADVNAARTSQRRDAGPSLAWMEVARNYLTDAEIAAFYQKHIFDIELADAPIRALARGARGVVAGAAPLSPYLRTAFRILAPEQLKAVVRWLVRRPGAHAEGQR